jgi:hypothetical protein
MDETDKQMKDQKYNGKKREKDRKEVRMNFSKARSVEK